MKRDYTILVPTMLPLHFNMLIGIFEHYGFHAELLETSGSEVVQCGLKYVHNDTCYPALLIIGQLINAVQSGKYDVHKIALMVSQTGGGCRASNYISLLRKALEKAGLGFIPVISINFSGLEKDSAFRVTLPMLHRMVYAMLYADLLMLLRNQVKPYETVPGTADRTARELTEALVPTLCRKKIRYKDIKANYRMILNTFDAIDRSHEKKIRVGIVGEIFVKFSPLGNNKLEEFLIAEQAEPVVPGFVDFCLYCVYNGIVDRQLYGFGRVRAFVSRLIDRFLVGKQKDLIACIREHGVFVAPSAFDHTRTLTRGYINLGAKMGEGWLLTAEMLELIESGVTSIVCAQPFGCLPNHIVGKGMMKRIKENHPDVNLVAVDYDPGATKINQENRIKLMLANAARQKEERAHESDPTVPLPR